MKSIIGASIMALLLVCLALPGLVLADAEGTSAAGSFKFALQDGETRFLEFKVTEQAENLAAGDMTYSDPVAIPVDDPDNPEKPTTQGLLLRARFDCMQTVKNTAVIGGEIFESNFPGAIGSRVLLVIEDNGIDGSRDRVAWGIFQNSAITWFPQDAEVPNDDGAKLTWWATDAERRDDVGIPAGLGLSRMVTCKSFPLAAIDFPEIKYAGGDLQIQQLR
ncbi:MAG TPA: hypothetical protein VFR78_03270 [Pyrinomonadaceae bacterium]|nr:hypothetical protein [Pyrinomonadaceae bacterium]